MVAIVVGTLCFLLSAGVVVPIGALVIVGGSRMNPVLGTVLTWVGPVPVVFAVGWSTVFLMERFERITGISLRTRSSRKMG